GRSQQRTFDLYVMNVLRIGDGELVDRSARCIGHCLDFRHAADFLGFEITGPLYRQSQSRFTSWLASVVFACEKSRVGRKHSFTTTRPNKCNTGGDFFLSIAGVLSQEPRKAKGSQRTREVIGPAVSFCFSN